MKRINNHLKTLILLGGLSGLLIGVGSLIAPGWSYGFTALALALNIGAYFFSHRVVLRAYGAREVSPEEAPQLHEMVAELALRAQIPKPKVCLIDAPYANAFATGRNPRNGVVAVTTGICSLLSERELRGVLAHELGHIKNRDILVSTIAAVCASAIGHIANVLSFSSMFGSRDESEEGASPLSALLVALIAPLAATLIQLGVSRSREYLADEEGARISGDPEALASALARLEHGATLASAELEPATASLFIVNPFAHASGLAHLFSTHPPMDERIRRLRRMAGMEYNFAA